MTPEQYVDVARGYDLLRDLVRTIHFVNPNRSIDAMMRRVGKLTEECGETVEAYLGATSPYNFKAKTWGDFHEEMVDCLIVAIDLCLTPLPDRDPGNRLDLVLSYVDQIENNHLSGNPRYQTDSVFLKNFLIHGMTAVGRLADELERLMEERPSENRRIALMTEQRQVLMWFYQFAMTQTPWQQSPSFSALSDIAAAKIDKWVNAKKGEDA